MLKFCKTMVQIIQTLPSSSYIILFSELSNIRWTLVFPKYSGHFFRFFLTYLEFSSIRLQSSLLTLTQFVKRRANNELFLRALTVNTFTAHSLGKCDVSTHLILQNFFFLCICDFIFKSRFNFIRF